MGELDTMDYLTHFIRRGIDNIDRVARAVGDIDPRWRLRRRLGNSHANSTNPFCDHKPVWVVLRCELPAPRVKRISSGLGRKRMEQKLAGSRIAGNDHLQSTLKVSL